MDEINQSLGSLLVQKGFVDKETLSRALKEQGTSGKRLGEALVDMGVISPEELYQVLARQMGVPFWDIRISKPDEQALKLLSPELAEKLRVLPVKVSDGVILVATANPNDFQSLEIVRAETGYEVQPCLSVPEAVEEAIHKYYSLPHNMKLAAQRVTADIPRGGPTARQAQPSESASPAEEKHPIIDLVNSIIQEAVHRGASDIHIEPMKDRLSLRYRIDGVLEPQESPPLAIHDALVTRLKVMAAMDIAERRLPQDGRLSMNVDGKPYDLRVATLPTVYGEKIVIRLLKQAQEELSLDTLGISQKVLHSLKQSLAAPYGMILLAGPTGSGKSTTLANCLKYLNSPGKNLVTVEDPVEYLVEGVNHTQVNVRAGLTFATALRHVLRQDPDVIMVGEIRDLETAEIALRAALTGHLVLTTIHANDALSALTRLQEMGVNKYYALSAIVALMSQRLVRVLCPWCKKPWTAPKSLIEEFRRITGNAVEEPFTIYRPGSCLACNNKGYRGRTMISEIILVDDAFRYKYLRSPAPFEDPDLNPVLRQQGMLADGVNKVLQGITSWEEVLRTTGVEDSNFEDIYVPGDR